MLRRVALEYQDRVQYRSDSDVQQVKVNQTLSPYRRNNGRIGDINIDVCFTLETSYGREETCWRAKPEEYGHQQIERSSGWITWGTE